MRAFIYSIKGHRSRDPNFIVLDYGVLNGYYPQHLPISFSFTQVFLGLIFYLYRIDWSVNSVTLTLSHGNNHFERLMTFYRNEIDSFEPHSVVPPICP
jgi:hypothetical protein